MMICIFSLIVEETDGADDSTKLTDSDVEVFVLFCIHACRKSTKSLLHKWEKDQSWFPNFVLMILWSIFGDVTERNPWRSSGEAVGDFDCKSIPDNVSLLCLFVWVSTGPCCKCLADSLEPVVLCNEQSRGSGMPLLLESGLFSVLADVELHSPSRIRSASIVDSCTGAASDLRWSSLSSGAVLDVLLIFKQSARFVSVLSTLDDRGSLNWLMRFLFSRKFKKSRSVNSLLGFCFRLWSYPVTVWSEYLQQKLMQWTVATYSPNENSCSEAWHDKMKIITNSWECIIIGFPCLLLFHCSC